MAKFSGVMGGKEYRPMHEEEIQELFNSPAGYLGPLHIEWASGASDTSKPLLIVDEALRGRKNLIAGANQEEYHVKTVTPDETFRPSVWADLRNAAEGEGCPNCGQPLKIGKAVEIGHIFKLGYKYSEPMGARVLDEHGKEVTPIMGSYGIGLERILTACIEQNNDDNGFWMPANIAPFEVVVTPTNTADEKISTGAEDIAKALETAGVDVLLDDRDERPGVKFKDADLIGVPYRINVGKKLGDGIVEVVTRAGSTREDVALGAVVEHVKKLVKG